MPNDTLTTPEAEEYAKIEQEQAKIKLRAWGLFGQLVMRGVIPPPDFDFGDPEDYEHAGMKMHNTIMALMLSLEGIDITLTYV